MATLTLVLNATTIKEAVKADSYITGQIDKSADMVKNAALAFNEQAGDEQYHENKLFRTMKASVGKLEASMVEYMETSDGNATIEDNLSPSVGQFNIYIDVNSRLNQGVAGPLAVLAQEFVINTMLYYWWQPIKPALAKDYLAFAADNLVDIRRCLAKSAPSTASYNAPSGTITNNSSSSSNP